AEQIEYWNEKSGPKWVAHQERLDAQIGSIGEEVMARAKIEQGSRIVDVGCGCGQTALQLASRVGPRGRVLAVDISGVMLASARPLPRSRTSTSCWPTRRRRPFRGTSPSSSRASA